MERGAAGSGCCAGAAVSDFGAEEAAASRGGPCAHTPVGARGVEAQQGRLPAQGRIQIVMIYVAPGLLPYRKVERAVIKIMDTITSALAAGGGEGVSKGGEAVE